MLLRGNLCGCPNLPQGSHTLVSHSSENGLKQECSAGAGVYALAYRIAVLGSNLGKKLHRSDCRGKELSGSANLVRIGWGSPLQSDLEPLTSCILTRCRSCPKSKPSYAGWTSESAATRLIRFGSVPGGSL